MKEQIQTFHQVKCRQAKNVIAFYILDASIKHCTNSLEMQLSNASLMIFHYNFDNKVWVFFSRIFFLQNDIILLNKNRTMNDTLLKIYIDNILILNYLWVKFQMD